MRITTAWADDGQCSPWIVSAYDEDTFAEHNGVPKFYRTAVDNTANTFTVRECVIEVPTGAIVALFDLPTIAGEVVES